MWDWRADKAVDQRRAELAPKPRGMLARQRDSNCGLLTRALNRQTYRAKGADESTAYFKLTSVGLW
jgi:hypothetical protein